MFRYRNSGFHGTEKSTPLLGTISNITRRNTLGDFMWKCSWKFGSKNVAFLTSRMFASLMIRVFPSLEYSAGHVRIPEDNL